MKRVVFDIETEPFTESFQNAGPRAEKRKHAPKLRLACVFIQATRKYRYFVQETASELISLLQSANEVISFNGENRVSLNQAAQINLGEKKHTDGRKMSVLTIDELRVACRSDVSQTYRLWKLYKAGKLQIPEKKFWPRTSSDSYHEMGPGEHMPDKCPNCGAMGSLEFVEWDTEGMTDGKLADYEAGFYGSAFCNRCKTEIDFGF